MSDDRVLQGPKQRNNTANQNLAAKPLSPRRFAPVAQSMDRKDGGIPTIVEKNEMSLDMSFQDGGRRTERVDDNSSINKEPSDLTSNVPPAKRMDDAFNATSYELEKKKQDD